MYAMILAGGKGERLRPLTDNAPKPMVPLCGKPILEHQIDWLKEGGVTDVVFLAGYLWDSIQDYFGDGSGFGFNATYSVEDSPLGRGGAIKKGYPFVPPDEETVVVLNGDIVTDERLDSILARHRERKSRDASLLATLLVVPMVSPYGLVDTDAADEVTGFREKVELPHWINGGVYVFDRAIFSGFPDLGDHEVETFPRLAQEGRIAAFKTRAFWTSIDSFKDLREAEEHMSRPQAA
jgi:NDP-sugar pyrophosphorylase family protein